MQKAHLFWLSFCSLPPPWLVIRSSIAADRGRTDECELRINFFRGGNKEKNRKTNDRLGGRASTVVLRAMVVTAMESFFEREK